MRSKGAARQGTGSKEGIPRFDMTEIVRNRNAPKSKARSSVAVATVTPVSADIIRVETLVDDVMGKIKELRLGGMINKDGADWMTACLIKVHAILEGMK